MCAFSYLQQKMRNLRDSTANELKVGFISFLTSFTRNGVLTYKFKTEQLIQRSQHLLIVSSIDLMEFSSDMWDVIAHDYYRYEPELNLAFTNYMRDLERNIKMIEEGVESKERSDQYYIGFDNIYGQDLKTLKCEKLGQLTAFKGTVTRTTEVRPELVSGVFRCLGCQQPSDPIEQQFKYTEPKKCRTMNCASNKWDLLPSMSVFSDFQKIRVQDDPSELSEGGMPRSFEVILRNQLCDYAQPGDTCVFTGTLCVAPELSSMVKPGERTQSFYKNTDQKGNSLGFEGVTGLKETGVRDLNYKLVFIANNIKVQNQQFKHEVEEDEDETLEDVEYSDEKEFKKIFSFISPSVQQKIKNIMENPNKYEALAESLFPSIYGNTEIKKAVLLQMFSGVHKTASANKISIRGDINVLIVGDPSTSKSMFLKSVEAFVPRSVYTNGKTTSAAGLTATVTRDENGDVGLEAGALMLADNGVCCIDEFDKMDIKDQVAIHEAMEQQTISIAKAGIYATLNARTSILAAANPLFGRYDKTKALKHNINLSAPIMSRFDLFFVICDEADEINDCEVGNFILSMHRNQDKALQQIYETKEIREYIKLARKIKPRLTLEAGELLRKCYSQLRARDQNNTSSYRVTVRQLESMIRLSEALARVNLSFEVTAEHIQEAFRLISMCIVKIEKSTVDLAQDELIQQINNISFNAASDRENVAQRQMNQDRNERRASYSISYEVYSQLQKNVIELFNAKEKQIQANPQMSEEPFGMQQGDIVDYLISQNLDGVNSSEQMEKSQKIINSVIKKLIDDERILIVMNDHDNVSQRLLYLHPNYIN